MESKFTGKAWSEIGMRIVTSTIAVCTLFIGAPWCHCMWLKWYKEHTYVNGCQLSFDGTGWQLLGNSLKWALLTLITVGIYGFWVPIKYEQWVVKHTHFAHV